MQQKLSYTDLQDQLLEALLYAEKFRKDEFSINEAIAAQTLSLTRKQLKPVYQKFKNNCKIADAELKAKHEAIATDFDEAIAGGDL
jgi:hypothetical protein